MASVIGYNTLLVSALQESPDPDITITFEEASWITSVWALASVVGCTLGGLLADCLGRRKGLMISTLPFFVSFIMMSLARNWSTILASRAVAGLGDGLMYPILPVYIAETASKKMRGSMNNVVNIAQNVGFMLVYSLSLLLPWRPLSYLLTVPPCIALVCLYPLPETPYWLARKGRAKEAEQSLVWLRGGLDCSEELEEILDTCVDREDSMEGSKGMFQGVRDRARLMASRQFLGPLLVAGPLFLLYVSSGFSLIGFYLVTIMEKSGAGLPPLLASLILVSWRFLFSLLSSLLLARCPRRPLFLWTTLLVTVSMASLGLYSYLSSLPSFTTTMASHNWLPILLIGLIFAGGQLGFSPIIKIIVSEVFPTDLRSTGNSFVFLCGALSLAVLTKLFAQFLTWFGLAGTLWVYSCITCLAMFYGYYFMPEHSNTSLAAIEKQTAAKQASTRARQSSLTQ